MVCGKWPEAVQKHVFSIRHAGFLLRGAKPTYFASVCCSSVDQSPKIASTQFGSSNNMRACGAGQQRHKHMKDCLTRHIPGMHPTHFTRTSTPMAAGDGTLIWHDLLSPRKVRGCRSGASAARLRVQGLRAHHDHAFVAAHQHRACLFESLHDLLLLCCADIDEAVRPVVTSCCIC